MSRLKKKLRSRKAGLPPGALIHIGDIKTKAISLSLVDFGPESYSEHELADLASLDAVPHTAGVRWLNVHGVHDPALLAAIGERFALHPLVIEDILNTDQRPKADDYDDYLFVVAHLYNTDPDLTEVARDQISLVVGHDFVLSFQERSTGIFAPLRQRLRADRSPLRRVGGDYLAYSMLDAIVDSYFGVTENLHERSEQLEEEILGKQNTGTLQGIHDLKRTAMQLRRTLWPLRETLNSLYRSQADFFRPETQLYLRDVYDHTVHVLESLEDLRDLLTGLLDIYLTTVSNRVNVEVRRLTVVATIFMPATLIAGIFGMNFRAMPWLEEGGGFWRAIAAMVGVALGLAGVFWRRLLLR
ncbi:MAG: magnesium/cobalt transporter CorA [Betaproteobacteria bacterium]|nr:magnesium/cobalt transporter CorA [Betaproteobacteria bacterium]